MNKQKNKKILLVDGKEIVREVLCGFLQSEGYEVTEAHNGTQAVEILKTTLFHTLITDIMMPDIDGLEILREARKNSPKTEIIIISETKTMSHEMTIKLGAKDFVSKSFRMEKFIKEILKSIEK
jgi:CheY-like chemotaxis protein